MGNGASCVPRCTRAAAAKVVGPDGFLRPIEAPAGAAEIMVEFPGHAVARAEEALRTRRAAGMRADEELLPGVVYFLLPLNRVGSRLSDCQVEALLEAVGRRRRRGKQGDRPRSRVFPEVGGGKERKVAVWEGELTGLSGKKVGGCRQWRPALDTIHECKG
ncbi:uncharacterized protein LOC122000007 [Zingiber officinale]|uniref:Uncharacterized protein n=1 Tax=Zingiber officinale TaxID=94328 RepID=A0A8J5M6R5_ZINOF|nr:uncharacterized protein LOC122000007 [Zingiber officinale]KAG6535635.1 hypothetical protein ZIOFF_000658 [Zingiber officinale]